MDFNQHIGFLVIFAFTVIFVISGFGCIGLWLYDFLTPDSWRFVDHETLMYVDVFAFCYFIFFSNIAGGLFIRSRRGDGGKGMASYY